MRQLNTPSLRYAAVCCFAAVILLRLPVLFRSVLDWDESLYVLMAQQWLQGHLPYTTIWDNKPLGIYAIFALFIAIFHNPVLAIRLATSLFAAVTAIIVWRLAPLLLGAASPALSARLAGLATAAFIIGSLSNDGLSANTELFMECFSAAAILAALHPGIGPAQPFRRGVGTGLLFGLACMTKYVAVFEAPAIALALLVPQGPAPQNDRHQTLARFAGAIAGAAFFPSVTLVTYAAAGRLNAWWHYSIVANLTRVAVPISGGALYYAAFTILPRWLPCIVGCLVLLAASPALAAAALRDRAKARATKQAIQKDIFGPFILLVWLAGGTVGVISAKSFYDHYFLQILPVSCLCLGWAVGRFLPGLGAWPPRRVLALFAALLLIQAHAGFKALRGATLPFIAWHANGPAFTPDPQTAAAAALRPAIAAGGTSLYVFDGQPILYALTGATPPTRFVLPSVLTKCFLANVAGVDAAAEVARILAQNPTFIVRNPSPPTGPVPINQTVYTEVTTDLQTRYKLWRSFPGAAIYQRRAEVPPLPAAPSRPPNQCVAASALASGLDAENSK